MKNINPEPDNIIDRTLAALRDAAPPEGMEGRVLRTVNAQHLSASREAVAPSRIRIFLAPLVPRSAWLRGAITGAATASLAFGAVLFANHLIHTRSSPQTANVIPTPSIPAPHPAQATPVSLNADKNSHCAPALRRARDEVSSQSTDGRVPHPSFAWAGSATTNARVSHLIPASFAPSKPAPPVPLTAQERALVQLVRTASPVQLAALSSASDEKSDAEREAAFKAFFAPSPELVAAQKAEEEATHSGSDSTQQPTEVQN